MLRAREHAITMGLSCAIAAGLFFGGGPQQLAAVFVALAFVDAAFWSFESWRQRRRSPTLR